MHRSLRLALLIALALGVALAACNPFAWWRSETADRDLGLIKDAGFGWVKQNFGWRDIEGEGKGIFDWSRTDRIVEQVKRYGLNLVVRVDY